MDISKIILELNEIFGRTRSRNAFLYYLKSHSELSEGLQRIINEEPWFSDLYTCGYCLYKGIFKKHHCLNCGKEIDVKSAMKGRVYCSVLCSNRSDDSKKKKIATTMLRYGTEYALQNPDVKEKLRHNNIVKYGTACPLQNDGIMKKSIRTNLERYGTEHPMKSSEYRIEIGYKSPFANPETMKKAQDTIFEKYGCSSTLLVNEVHEKAVQTNLVKYGSESPLKSKEIQNKIKNTNLIRRGVENVFQSDDVKQAIKNNNMEKYGVSSNALRPDAIVKKRNTMLDRYGVDNPSKNAAIVSRAVSSRLALFYDRLADKWKDYVVPMFSKEEYAGCASSSYKWKCVRCGNEFEQIVHTTGNGFIPRCWNCFPRMCGQSYKEKELSDFIKTIYDGDVVLNERSIIDKELDIYIPEKGVAIEFDGLYWHSEAQGKGESYHLSKTEQCLENGIQLIHVFEDEWMNKNDIVKDRISTALGMCKNRIFARKCILKEVNSKECSDFLDENHLQGADKSKIRYGLYYEDELVAVMTFGKPRFNRNYDWELIRLHPKSDAM